MEINNELGSVKANVSFPNQTKKKDFKPEASGKEKRTKKTKIQKANEERKRNNKIAAGEEAKNSGRVENEKDES